MERAFGPVDTISLRRKGAGAHSWAFVTMHNHDSVLRAVCKAELQVKVGTTACSLNRRRAPVRSCRLFLRPGFRLAARWNRLVETVKTRKKRGKTGEKWASYGLKLFAR